MKSVFKLFPTNGLWYFRQYSSRLVLRDLVTLKAKKWIFKLATITAPSLSLSLFLSLSLSLFLSLSRKEGRKEGKKEERKRGRDQKKGNIPGQAWKPGFNLKCQKIRSQKRNSTLSRAITHCAQARWLKG